MTTREEIEAQLQQMEPEQLALREQLIRSLTMRTGWDAWEAMLAAESSLRKDWESAKEVAAWANL